MTLSRRTAALSSANSSTSFSTPASSTTIATSMSSSSMPRLLPKTSSSRSPSTIADQNQPRSTFCQRSGFATPGPGPRTAPDPHCSRSSGRAGSSRRPLCRITDPRPSTTCTATGMPAAVHRERDEHERLWGTPNASPYVKDGINDYVVHGADGRRQPGRRGYQGRGALSAERRRRRRQRRSACGSTRARRRAARAVPRFRRDLRAIDRTEADRVLRRPDAPAVKDDSDRAGVMRQALAGLLWSKQFFISTSPLARRAWRSPLQPGSRACRNREWFHMLNQRHHLDAGQVGVSLVRSLGPRVPHGAALDGRPGLRKRAARADAVGVVSPSERADPGLRVELQRRQPAGPRLGDPVRLPQRAGLQRARTTSSSSSRSSTSSS